MGVARPRLHYLDWLRTLAVFGVFVYHAAQPFSTDDWHVKNAELSEAVDVPIAFFGSWGIGFFFLVAGTGTFFALGWRTPGQFVRERVMRLVLPLAAAYVVLGPIQAYLEATHFGRYSGSFISFVPRFFGGLWSDVRAVEPWSDPLLVGRMYHLWFLVFLIWFSLLTLPLFLWLRGSSGRRLTARLGRLGSVRGGTLLFAIVVAGLTVAVWAAAPDEHGWGEFVYYLGFFVAGFVVLADDRLIGAVRRDTWLAIGVGLAGAAVLLGIDAPGFLEGWESEPSYSWMYAGVFGALAVQAWAWAQAAFGLGSRLRAFQRPLPSPVGRAAMPFFIVHQPVIVAVAYVVVHWDAGIPLKFAAVFAASFVLSALLATMLAWTPFLSTAAGVKRSRTLDATTVVQPNGRRQLDP